MTGCKEHPDGQRGCQFRCTGCGRVGTWSEWTSSIDPDVHHCDTCFNEGKDSWLVPECIVPESAASGRASKPRCSTCKFWEFIVFDDGKMVADGGKEGICHRYPPKCPSDAPDIDHTGFVPTTWDDYWCGEYVHTSNIPTCVNKAKQEDSE